MPVTARVGIQGATGATGGVVPFLFRMTPTAITDFGAGRSASVNVPTITAMTDIDGRPFVRFNSPTDNAIKLFPLLDSVGAKIIGANRFRVEMFARWTAGIGATQRVGIGFNADHIGALMECYAVGNGNAGGTNFDSQVSGAVESQTVNNSASIDAGVGWTALHVDVYLNTTTSYCTYTYGPMRDGIAASFAKQRRKTALVVAGGTGVCLYSSGGPGYLDIAELVVWKNERNW